MSFDTDGEEPLAFPLDPARIPELDLATLRQYLHRVIEALPETALRTLARMMSLTARPPVRGDY
jgi:hypothetical protein